MWVWKTWILVFNDEMIQIQKYDNAKDQYNTLSTHLGSELIIYTSAGNFQVYKMDESENPLKLAANYYQKNSAQIHRSDPNINIIEFENEDMKEVSSLKIFENYLILTYWDTDKGKSYFTILSNYCKNAHLSLHAFSNWWIIASSKWIEFLDKNNLNNVLAKHYFNTKSIVKEETEMDVDGNTFIKPNEDKTYRDYLYSIISIEVVKYHSDFHYLLCGADNGYWYTFCFKSSVLKEKLDNLGAVSTEAKPTSNEDAIFNMRSIALGNSPVYLNKMKTNNESEVRILNISSSLTLFM